VIRLSFPGKRLKQVDSKDPLEDIEWVDGHGTIWLCSLHNWVFQLITADARHLRTLVKRWVIRRRRNYWVTVCSVNEEVSR
jgi:hypothetical protein